MRRKLPVGIQTFRTLREEDCYYVDKTPWIWRLNETGSRYFLSRPRRFGKSLLVDTIKELFEGSEELFRDLYIQDRWDWSVRHPVVRLDFSYGSFTEPGSVHANLMAQLDEIERDAPIERRYDTGPERFAHLIATLHRHTGQRVVVLVDEYDKPILEALGTPDLAKAHRSYLRAVYSVIKGLDADVKFAFITGVSKFSKVSLFSDLNNLVDLTLNPDQSAICGYTDRDLDTVFAPEIGGLDRTEVRERYNGYGWGGEEKVYNPFDILLLFYNRAFGPWWFETGTPTFLLETLVRHEVDAFALGDLRRSETLLSAFDVEHIAPEALLFQTGYLTIRESERRAGRAWHRLGYPNREVYQSLNEHLLDHLTGNRAGREENSSRLHDLLLAGDLEGLKEVIHAFFASIPHDWHRRNDLARYEGYYASVFYAYFAGLGLDVVVEESTSLGRLDMTVRFGERVWIFEFKVVEQAEEGGALAQVREKRYADKYHALGVPIHLVGVEFSRKERNVTRFDVEHA